MLGEDFNLRRKKIYTTVAATLLLCLYIAIFCFSAEEGEESSALSRKVTEMILKVYHGIVGGADSGAGNAAAVWDSSLEGIIRKLAHFMEYMCMGLLSYSIVVLWYKPLWRGRFFVLLQLVISAGMDEFHQYFIPGRFASFKDVLIDTAGGIAGILVIIILCKIREKITNRPGKRLLTYDKPMRKG